MVAAVSGGRWLQRAACLRHKATQQLWITYKLRRDGDKHCRPEALAARSVWLSLQAGGEANGPTYESAKGPNHAAVTG